MSSVVNTWGILLRTFKSGGNELKSPGREGGELYTRDSVGTGKGSSMSKEK